MKKVLIMTVLFLFVFSFSCDVKAYSFNENYQYLVLADNNEEQECEAIFGDPENSNSIAYMLQEVFDFIKFLDVVLILLLTIVEFTKAITAGDDAIKKAINTTGKRVIAGVIIFFVPTVLNFIFNIIGFYGTCGIG